ncbi:hypothetical protein [Burkholderia pyrrocinia]|uniref:hypothetical protein n=1 Tax=Burkholderia pyrrocinia TaxID=60550 RepID=UPI001F28AD2A|nr:hypothetical protein [Burkholderia pyrrocinia]
MVPAVLQVAWAGTMPAPDNARKTPVGNRNLGIGSPAFFERARFMFPPVIGFGIGIAVAPNNRRQKITDKSVRAGGRDATSAYSWMNL